MNHLSIRNLSMQFGGLKALNNVSFDVEKNSIFALIGPNGAGKTTLFNCLTGFYKAHEGKMTFYDPEAINLIDHLGPSFAFRLLLSPKALIRYGYFNIYGGSHHLAKLGIVRTFQHARLFRDMTVIENLLIGQHQDANRNWLWGFLNSPHFQKSENQLKEKAFQWLDLFQLSNDANRLAGTLPFAKQRLLEIARALCAKPKILCLDEPAAGLNAAESEMLSQTLLHLKKAFGITLILIEHDMSVVMNISDQIAVLVKGELIAQGRPKDIQNNEKVIEAYLGMPSKSEEA